MKGTLFGDLPDSKDASKNNAVPQAPKPALASAAPVKRHSAPPQPRPVAKKARQPAAVILSEPIQGEHAEASTQGDAYDPRNPNDYGRIIEQKLRSRQVLEARLDAMGAARSKARKAEDRAGDRAAANEGQEEKGLPLAKRMMEKMGWKRGQGLGKANQGITTALVVKKTSARGGTVVVPPQKKP
jgi:hypothetical protein